VPDAQKINGTDPARNKFIREEASGVVIGVEADAFNEGRAIPTEERVVDHLNKPGGDAESGTVEMERWGCGPKLAETTRETASLGCTVSGEEGEDVEE
jgi:hypothetical protein